jgi:hypothetical protein
MGILMVGCGSCAMQFYAWYPEKFSLFTVAVHLPRKVSIFFLADGIKEFGFAMYSANT